MEDRHLGQCMLWSAMVGGKDACADLTRVSPVVGLGTRAFTMGQTFNPHSCVK